MDTFARLFLVAKLLLIGSLSRTKHDLVFVHPTTLSQVIPVSMTYLPIYGFKIPFQVYFSWTTLFRFQIFYAFVYAWYG
jgi:hypothetical protein